MDRLKYLKNEFGISEKVFRIAENAHDLASASFSSLNNVKEYNQYKVIKAFQTFGLSDSMFSGTSGYGYDDKGRDTIDSIYAKVFGAEAALVRTQIVSGTHALAICLFGVLRPGMNMLCVTGKPYDTLEEVIGISGTGQGSLKDFGVEYRQIELNKEGKVDIDKISENVDQNTGLILMQRSRGYEWRDAFSIEEIRYTIEKIKSIKSDVIVLVDNCYGEFLETQEPNEVGADLIAGSLIKNPGGGLAFTGGYIAGKTDLVKLASYRYSAPGIGGHVGPSLNQNRTILQGLFMAPHVVVESLKGAIYTSAFMDLIGFEVSPKVSDKRGDIIQAIMFNDEKLLISFCEGIQKGSPVDSFVKPYPWDMPGYSHKIIMAAGGFIQGSSIELSADAPIKPPYIAYLQGGLVYEHVKLGVIIAVEKMVSEGLLRL
ncbi:MAG: methionine gamma-lyase family protein [Bacillota bacterium]